VRLATRGSPLALVQATIVSGLLVDAAPGLVVERVVVRTVGDRRADVELDRLGGQGAFAKEVQAAVLDGRADVAVHSAKDLPPETPPGLVLAAVPERADPRDVLVGRTLAELPTGALVATGSARRRAQLANLRPDLTFVGLRGNMGTRLDRARDGAVGAVGAVVAAAAALDRLGWSDRIAERLSVRRCLPQVGQGALALECRDDDDGVRRLLDAVDVRAAHRALAAERAFLAALGAGCAVPAAAWAAPAHPGATRLVLRGLLASGDGRVVVREELEGDDPHALGRALAELLVTGRGGSSIEGWQDAVGSGGAARAGGAPR
jgi:hydroxymethylbilane synthase